jgi:transcriptional regulator with XRE-family HTH domain
MDIAAALRAARRTTGLSQKKLARRVGLSAGALSRYESGASQPSLPTLDRILAACGKDLRLVLVDRVDDLDVELARRATLPLARRCGEIGFLRPAFLERLVRHDTQVLVGGSWAAELHGIPAEPAEGRLLVADEAAALTRLATAFMAGSVPWRETEGHFGSLSVRPTTFVEHSVVRWRQADVGSFRTEVVPDGVAWPLERRVDTPDGPLRVLAAHELTEADGVPADVLRAWTAWRAAAGPDNAPWRAT